MSARLPTLRRCLLPMAVLAALLAMPAAAELAVSREVGLPLQAARQALDGKRYDVALKEVDKARAVATITAQEKWAVEQMRAAIYKAQGRFDLAATAFEAAITLVPLSEADQAGALETLAQLWYRSGDYGKSVAFGEKAMAAGRRSDGFRHMVAEAYYRSKEPAKAAKLLHAWADDLRKAGRSLSSEAQQLLAASEFMSGNNEGYIKALRQQLQVESTRENWQRLLDAMAKGKPVPERLDLDWARLKLAVNAYDNPDSLTEMAQRAMVEELPAEAAAALDQGWASGLLGKPGPKLERQQRLREYATTQLAAQKQGLEERQRQVLAGKDANTIAKLGMVYASLGQPDQAIALLQQALKGKLISPAAVRLRLGMLQYRAGQNQAAAQTMAALPAGSDEARLGGVWGLIYLQR
ncbi:tetratricopeptide repeat protein [Niveispirillum sp. KHB5.9]|uniref:tetratricopeptide repeat protein n=1 Tax=Niveispirillum sp. KHB5.9 TaxID=3400269 RepID=UPI003A86FA2A